MGPLQCNNALPPRPTCDLFFVQSIPFLALKAVKGEEWVRTSNARYDTGNCSLGEKMCDFFYHRTCISAILQKQRGKGRFNNAGSPIVKIHKGYENGMTSWRSAEKKGVCFSASEEVRLHEETPWVTAAVLAWRNVENVKRSDIYALLTENLSTETHYHGPFLISSFPNLTYIAIIQ